MKFYKMKIVVVVFVGFFCIGLVGVQDLLVVKDLINKYIEVIGGEDKIKFVMLMCVFGFMENFVMGMIMEMEMVQKVLNQFYMKMMILNIGEIIIGFNGEIGWVFNLMIGVMFFEGDQFKDVQKQVDFYLDFKYDEFYLMQEIVEVLIFVDEEVYKVCFVDIDGKESFQYFFVKSGLMIGFEVEQMSEMGMMMVVFEICEYKDFDGFKVFIKMVQKMMGMEMMMNMNEVIFGDVDEFVFELFEVIQMFVGN